MRTHILLTLLVLVIATPVLADLPPFVEDGEVVATVVVGQDAPSTDVILGAEVAAYLQTFAEQARTGLAQTSDTVSLSDGPLILIGIPSDNPLIQEALDLQQPIFDGPFLRLVGDDMIISGMSAAEVSAAAAEFRSDERRLGQIEDSLARPEPIDAELPDDESEERPAGSVEDAMLNPPERPVESEPEFVDELDPAPSCEPERFCRNDAVYARGPDCAEGPVQYCPDGCSSGSCVQSGLARFFSGIVDLFMFWR